MDNLLELDRDSPEYIKQWIITSWPSTGAQAYESYQQSGPGLLLIDLANGEPVPDFNLGLRARSEYVPADRLDQHPALDQLSAGDMGRLLEIVSDYEPEQHAVFCFTRRKGGVLFFLAGWPERTARAAYEQRGQKPKPLPELRGRAFGRG